MIGTVKQIIQWLLNQPQEKQFEIEEYKDRRSNNANKYCWKLCSLLAEAQQPPLKKEDVYIQMLEDYGQSMLIPVKVGQKPDGFFKYFKYITTSTINGKEADWYKVFKGSSDFNTKEMSILIDGLKQECDNVGICTLPPEEIERLKEMWKP